MKNFKRKTFKRQMPDKGTIKKLTLALLLLIAFAPLKAQELNFKLAETESTLKKENTKYTLEIDSLKFEAYLTTNGQNYILRTSKKTGKEYRQYLGYDWPQLFEGKPVYTNKEKSEFWILGLTKTGYPKKIKLDIL